MSVICQGQFEKSKYLLYSVYCLIILIIYIPFLSLMSYNIINENLFSKVYNIDETDVIINIRVKQVPNNRKN